MVREWAIDIYEGKYFMDFSVGEVVITKKKHPCGGDEWEILRRGADFKIKCVTCGRTLMMDRLKFEKSVKKIKTDSAGG